LPPVLNMVVSRNHLIGAMNAQALCHLCDKQLT
jgi:hypothetical protein